MSAEPQVSRHDLAQAIDELSGQVLDEIQHSRPFMATSPPIELVRLLGVNSEQARKNTKLMAGLWSWNQEVLFALHHRAAELAILVGGRPSHEESGALHRYLSGHYPDCKSLFLAPKSLLDAVATLPHGIALSGVPEPDSAGLDSLAAGLGGGEWLYLVVAQPMSDFDVRSSLEHLAAEDRWLTDSYMRSGTVESANHPLAKSYHDLLAAAIKLREQGRREGMWRVRTFLFAEEESAAQAGQALLAAAFGGNRSLPQPIRCFPCPRGTSGLADTVPCTELPTTSLSILCQTPTIEVPGFRVQPRRRFSQNPPPVGQRSVALGRLLPSGAPENDVKLGVDSLTRHLFISGTTGSGKSETTKLLLTQLWQKHRIPFLVLEPAKREYRNLLKAPGCSDLLVFTLGDETEAPFRLNPLEVPPGVPVQTHIDLLRTLFRATFAGLYPPLPYLLEQALVDVYEAGGWNLSHDAGGARLSPTLRDLVDHADSVARRASYAPELEQNVRAALRVRLESLLLGGKGAMLNTHHSIPFEVLVNRPAVLELASIGDPEIVAFLIGALLIRLYEGWSCGPVPCQAEGTLRHVTVLEEAHRLLTNTTASSHLDTSSIQSHAVENLCQLLAEVRAHGEGMIVVDQSPAKLHPDVLRSTNTKLVHRLVAGDDRQASAASMNMKKDQVRALASFATGEAAYFPELAHEPVLVQVHPRQERRTSQVSVKAHMTSFYAANPNVFSMPSSEETPDKARDELAALTRDIESLVASVPPENLWNVLAAHLKRVAADTPRSGEEADPTLKALSLGLAVGDRLALSPEIRAQYRSGLAAALFGSEEAVK